MALPEDLRASRGSRGKVSVEMLRVVGFCFGPLSQRSLGLRMGRDYPIELPLNRLCRMASPQGSRASRAVVESRVTRRRFSPTFRFGGDDTPSTESGS